MSGALKLFEQIVRGGQNVGQSLDVRKLDVHPFDERNIHPEITEVTLKLFDDGHFALATTHAFIFLESQVKKLSGIDGTGFKLMMEAFAEKSPKIALTDLVTISDCDEQIGYRHIFAGVMSAIRNRRAHES